MMPMNQTSSQDAQNGPIWGRVRWGLGGAIASLLALSIMLPAAAQEFVREGKLQFVMLEGIAAEDPGVVSRGVLAELETDPNFVGDFELIFSDAFNILNDYTPVARGGFFPENAGIPREQQVTVDEAIYRLYTLNDEGLELMLYRSPVEGTSRYFIREN